MFFSKQQVDEMLQLLRSLPQKKREPQYTRAEVIRILARQIKAAQKRGYTIEEIAELLKEKGLSVRPTTIKQYLQRFCQDKKATKDDTRQAQLNGNTGNIVVLSVAGASESYRSDEQVSESTEGDVASESPAMAETQNADSAPSSETTEEVVQASQEVVQTTQEAGQTTEEAGQSTKFPSWLHWR